MAKNQPGDARSEAAKKKETMPKLHTSAPTSTDVRVPLAPWRVSAALARIAPLIATMQPEVTRSHAVFHSSMLFGKRRSSSTRLLTSSTNAQHTTEIVEHATCANATASESGSAWLCVHSGTAQLSRMVMGGGYSPDIVLSVQLHDSAGVLYASGSSGGVKGGADDKGAAAQLLEV